MNALEARPNAVLALFAKLAARRHQSCALKRAAFHAHVFGVGQKQQNESFAVS
jgi:hypothetical protein